MASPTSEGSQTLIILDNTVLSNFANVQRSDLIFRVWGTACTTPQVMEEYQRGVRVGKLPTGAWDNLTVLAPTPAEINFAEQRLPNLGAGERSCLAVAFHRSGFLVTDDKQARSNAAQLNIPVSGTLGILAFCVLANHIPLDQANLILQEMIAFGYRTPVRDLKTVLPE